MSKIVGLPCVGGKSQLAPYLCDMIESVCYENNIRKYISGCGGGGKDVFSLCRYIFDELVYNEYETGLADLVEVLSEDYFAVDKIQSGINDLIDDTLTNASINIALKKSISKNIESDNEIITDEELKKTIPEADIKELKIRALFKEIIKMQTANTNAAHGGEGVRLDKLTSAIYETILIYGSVQHNRRSILYRSKTDKRDFYTDIRQNATYAPLLDAVAKRAHGINVLNDDVIKIVNENINNEDVFIYIDPPYWNCTNDYENTFDFNKHIELINACKNSKSKIMISMHQDGIAPYFLVLFEQSNWRMYETPVITHTTKRNNLSDKMESMLFEGGYSQLAETIKKVEATENISLLDNKTVNEYIFCNFEISDNINFYEISMTEDGEIIGHRDPNDNFSRKMITKDMVYTLYSEIKQKKSDNKVDSKSSKNKKKSDNKADKKNNIGVDEEICKDVLSNISNAIIASFDSLSSEESIVDAECTAESLMNIESIVEQRMKVQRKGKKMQPVTKRYENEYHAISEAIAEMLKRKNQQK